MIYLDNAATTGKKPISVIRAVEKALTNYSANPGRSGHKPSEETAAAVYRAREKAARFFGASGPENVAFTANCTHSLNCVIKGVLGYGDHAIVSNLEHNSVMRPLYKIGINFDSAEVSLTDDDATIRDFERKIRPNTKLIICTGASNVLGKMLPLKDIGLLARKRGILFAVDAAQIAGISEINMEQMYIDYLCVAPHKGLYAPMGTGILICEKPLKNTVLEGGTGTDSINPNQPDTMPEQIESGTVNVPGIMGVAAGIDYVSSKGVNNIYRHEMQLCRLLYKGLEKNKNIILYTPYPEDGMYAPVISFNMKGVKSDELARILDRSGIYVRAGLHCAPTAHRLMGTLETGSVRVCPSAFTSPQEIFYLLRVLKSIKSV